MPQKHYCKLVRDRIPEIIRAAGGQCETEVLAESAYLELLEQKLQEELTEYLESREPEELADLLEVMQAVAAARGISWETVLSVQADKRQARGGFQKRILLRSVSEKK